MCVETKIVTTPLPCPEELKTVLSVGEEGHEAWHRMWPVQLHGEGKVDGGGGRLEQLV